MHLALPAQGWMDIKTFMGGPALPAWLPLWGGLWALPAGGLWPVGGVLDGLDSLGGLWFPLPDM